MKTYEKICDYNKMSIEKDKEGHILLKIITPRFQKRIIYRRYLEHNGKYIQLKNTGYLKGEIEEVYSFNNLNSENETLKEHFNIDRKKLEKILKENI